MVSQFNDPNIQEIWPLYQSMGAPDEFMARIDALVWGKSRNLWVLVTDVSTAAKYRFSTFFDKQYAAEQGGYSLKNARIGICFRFVTKTNYKGWHSLTRAVPLT